MRVIVAVLFFSLLWGGHARAQMLEIAPVSIMFMPEQRTASVTVTNRSTAPVVIQVRPFLWRENNGTSTLTDTAALGVSPPFTEIAPGQAQSVRMVLRTPPGATEETYRLLIDQLPPPNTTGVRVALRISLPVFIQPTAQANAALVWQIMSGRSGSELHVQNRGNRHVTVISAQMQQPSGGQVAIRTSAHPYVLSGAASQWPIGPARLPAGGAVRLTVTTDAGLQEVQASVVNAPP